MFVYSLAVRPEPMVIVPSYPLTIVRLEEMDPGTMFGTEGTIFCWVWSTHGAPPSSVLNVTETTLICVAAHTEVPDVKATSTVPTDSNASIDALRDATVAEICIGAVVCSRNVSVKVPEVPTHVKYCFSCTCSQFRVIGSSPMAHEPERERRRERRRERGRERWRDG